ncbi:exported hypothetical protein [Mesorhizobium plurifarium]|uniref:Uncharacterized protein n=1 Tax=Mesorhizobium plurifarium TaxID=69974 RepID=A0A090FPU5_MESPL|nr:exported hypothetical protein [Mesorhizobium plurifarium]
MSRRSILSSLVSPAGAILHGPGAAPGAVHRFTETLNRSNSLFLPHLCDAKRFRLATKCSRLA